MRSKAGLATASEGPETDSVATWGFDWDIDTLPLCLTTRPMCKEETTCYHRLWCLVYTETGAIEMSNEASNLHSSKLSFMPCDPSSRTSCDRYLARTWHPPQLAILSCTTTCGFQRLDPHTDMWRTIACSRISCQRTLLVELNSARLGEPGERFRRCFPFCDACA